jgi:hypothetical protein
MTARVDRRRESRYPSAVTGESRSDDGASPGEHRAGADPGVPRLPRGRGLKLSRVELIRIAGLAILLVFLLVTQRPCASAVSTFVTGFGGGGSASSPLPRPDTVGAPAQGSAGTSAAAPPGDDGYERLRPGMTDAELRAAIERARARAGSASAPPP